jgi:two-component system, NtrC family, response regulator HydG
MERDQDAVLQIGGYSSHMRAIMSRAARVALVDTTVLLTGESGVGKEHLAQLIHDRSSRNSGKFVAINCAALTGTLLESEMFGHKRGAFTGAIADRAGLFEAADQGTLFLDEIGELAVEMQASLLRALQQREVRRIGDNFSRPVDVRIIAATNRDLEADVDAHRFRQDLFYRLNVFHLHIPPLRERPEDLQLLADTLLHQTAERLRRPVRAYTPRAIERILSYDWPGNIRDLQNAIEHACVMAVTDRIDLEDLPDTVRGVRRRAPDSQRVRPLREVEREHILTTLKESGGNRRLAAQRLQIGTATLQRKLRRYRREQQTAGPVTTRRDAAKQSESE